MPTLRLGELVEASGGRLLRGDAGTAADQFVIDTRRLRAGGVFFALEGQHADGHAFLGDALERGAAAAVVGREPAMEAPAPPALILVDDPAAALAACATHVRRAARAVRWIAVTGSNGKTTTKELIAAGLESGFRVHRTAGNLNNHLGVPLTLLALPDDAQVAVVEEAMSGPGEIAQLTRITDPDVGLVTNVRAAHLRFFASLDDIAAAKGELFAVLRAEATAVVNLDDSHVRVQAARHDGPRVTFGQHAAADVRLDEVRDAIVPGAWFRFVHDGRGREVQLRLFGAHSAANAVAALAAVLAAGGDLDAAAARMAQVEPVDGRGKIWQLEHGTTVIDDSYNSSPAALASVLDSLKLTKPAGRRVLIMGDMLELGPLEGAMHREAGKRAAAAGVQMLIAVGPLARAAAESARRAGVPEVYHHKDAVRAAEEVREFVRDGDVVLVKGSRAMHLGRVVRALTGGEAESH